MKALHPAGRKVEQGEAEACGTEWYRLRNAELQPDRGDEDGAAGSRPADCGGGSDAVAAELGELSNEDAAARAQAEHVLEGVVITGEFIGHDDREKLGEFSNEKRMLITNVHTFSVPHGSADVTEIVDSDDSDDEWVPVLVSAAHRLVLRPSCSFCGADSDENVDSDDSDDEVPVLDTDSTDYNYVAGISVEVQSRGSIHMHTLLL